MSHSGVQIVLRGVSRTRRSVAAPPNISFLGPLRGKPNIERAVPRGMMPGTRVLTPTGRAHDAAATTLRRASSGVFEKGRCPAPGEIAASAGAAHWRDTARAELRGESGRPVTFEHPLPYP